MDDEALGDDIYDMALEHAESYGRYPYPDDIEVEDDEMYSDGICGAWSDEA